MSGSKPALPSRVRPIFDPAVRVDLTKLKRYVPWWAKKSHLVIDRMMMRENAWAALEEPAGADWAALEEPAAAEEASGKSLHVEVTFFRHGNIAQCQCVLCNAIKSALMDACKISRQTKLVLTFVPGEAGWPYE